MFRVIRFWSIVIFFVTGMLVVPALASSSIDEGTQESGAAYRIYFPENWNGDLVVFAHSYVFPTAPGTPPEIQDSELSIDGKSPPDLPDLFTGKGYAFAVTSYSKTGLAVVQGVADVVDLAGIFKATWGNPKNVYLVGLSQGGLVCTLALEQHPEVFSGGLSLCGPIGNFRGQINYWGDFRAVFDYFFPGLIPGSAVGIPTKVNQDWLSYYEQQVIGAIKNNLEATGQLLLVAHAPADPNNPVTVGQTVIGLLRYNVLATDDAKRTLNGQPFDNLDRLYGSDNDSALNLGVQRFEAQPTALSEVQADYETSGLLTRPLVSMHTKYDPFVPYWHEALYQNKTTQHGLAGNYIGITFERYGHVNFTAQEVSDNFDFLVDRVKGNR
jgi:pimeloyl-ACP methyl ester carboxylesterase